MTRATLHPVSTGARLARLLMQATLVLCLVACGSEVTLQSGLTEADANEVISLLRRSAIEVGKTQAKAKDGVTLTVRDADLARATELMQAAGLPRRSLAHLGQVFKKDGMISTPLEERARYLYGLSQELEYTLSQIDRVVVARVHIVLPERVAPGEPVKPSSASVFIKYRPPLDEDLVIPRVKRLVTTSIPGLGEDEDGRKLSVVMMPAQATEPSVAWERVGPFVLTSETSQLFRTSVTIGASVLALLALVMLGRRFPVVTRLVKLLRQRAVHGLGRAQPDAAGAGSAPPRPVDPARRQKPADGGLRRVV